VTHRQKCHCQNFQVTYYPLFCAAVPPIDIYACRNKMPIHNHHCRHTSALAPKAYFHKTDNSSVLPSHPLSCLRVVIIASIWERKCFERLLPPVNTHSSSVTGM